MQRKHVVHIYTEALALTQRMCEAARASDWDALVKLEEQRDSLIADARGADPRGTDTPELRQQQRALIEEILARDEEVKVLTQDWMRELREILESADNAQRLSKTYSQN